VAGVDSVNEGSSSAGRGEKKPCGHFPERETKRHIAPWATPASLTQKTKKMLDPVNARWFRQRSFLLDCSLVELSILQIKGALPALTTQRKTIRQTNASNYTRPDIPARARRRKEGAFLDMR
jgi:hypothetical protein